MQERAVGHARAAAAVAGVMGLDSTEALQGLVVSTAQRLKDDFDDDSDIVRAVIVDDAGTLLVDSADPRAGARRVPLMDREEIKKALAGTDFHERRHSDSLGTDIHVAAFPILRGGRTIGAVRLTQSAASLEQNLSNDWRTALLVSLAIVVPLGLGAAFLLARRIARPILELKDAAEMVTGGKLSARAPIQGSDEQRGVARAFNDMTDRLERLLRGQREFVANASHQLRTPLTGLRLRLELLTRRLAGDHASERHAEEALHEVDRLAQIIDELLVLSRAGQHGEAPERTDLNQVATEAAERWRGTAGERGIELRLVTTGDSSEVWCARADAERVVDVLIENALAYSPRDTTVAVAVGRGTLEVLDEGPGLAPGEEEAVFERFHRGRAGRAGPTGTGLGLPIARELAERWHGTAELTNREAGGACARVSLPPAEQATDSRRDFTLA
jgi:two-component system, OmpR family, sensor kinase